MALLLNVCEPACLRVVNRETSLVPDHHIAPAAPAPDWPTCRGQRCIGIQVDPFGRCLAHLTPTELDQALKTLGPGADLDARGTTFTQELLQRVVETFRDNSTPPRFGTARFDGAQFSGYAEFAGAQFRGDAGFDGAQFRGDVRFDRAQFRGYARFDDAQFEKVERLGPVTVASRLALDRAGFGRSVQIEVAASEVSVRQVSFAANATLRLRYATVVLDGVVSSGPMTVVGATEPFTLPQSPDEPKRVDESLLAQAGRDVTPSLLSLRGVDASRLVLVNLNLSDCQFTEAHHLDQLRIEGRCRFTDTPGWARLGRTPVWRYTRRQVLAEERTWRTTHHRMPWTHLRPGLTGQPPLEAERLVVLYRQLRKAQEDAKNEPGAADFYYGEMEMRRHASSGPVGERLVLTAYWALSGYGLRATRALAAVLVVLALATVGFATVGFAPSEQVEYHPIGQAATGQPTAYRQVSVPGPRPGWSAAVDHSIDSATSLLRATQPEPLTLTGRVVEIALRLLGPLLLGLAVLAIRNRVKR